MDVTTTAKTVGVFVAIFGIWKVLYEIKTGRKTHLRAEYDFAKKFLSDVSEGTMHPYPMEKGYQAIAGTNIVKADEIAYILTLEDPVQCLKDYVLSKQLMEKIETKGDLKLKFKMKYSGSWARNWRKTMYLSLYFILAFSALSPFVIQNTLKTNLSDMAIQLLFSIPFGGLYAWGSLNAYSKIKRGESLIDNQKGHTQRVIIET